jgi:hypothetical protein
MRKSLLILLLTALACTPAGPPTLPNDREWSLLTADYQWLETVRAAQKKPPATATRKEQIELALDNLKKLEPTYNAFMDKVHEYHQRTADPRAARSSPARRSSSATSTCRSSRATRRPSISIARLWSCEPASPDAQQRIAYAGEKRFVSMTAFANVKTGMKEDAVQRLVGLPREDWIKQVVQNKRVYSVWIYPKSDGGARPQSTLTTASFITQTGTRPPRRRRLSSDVRGKDGGMEEHHAVDDQSHYEISLTAGQAFVAFVLLLLSLAASFAFGLMIGKGQADERLVVRKETPVVTEARSCRRKTPARSWSSASPTMTSPDPNRPTPRRGRPTPPLRRPR